MITSVAGSCKKTTDFSSVRSVVSIQPERPPRVKQYFVLRPKLCFVASDQPTTGVAAWGERWLVRQAVRTKTLGVLLVFLSSRADGGGRKHRTPAADFEETRVYPDESRPDFDAYRLLVRG